MDGSMNRHDAARHDLGGADFARDPSGSVSNAYRETRCHRGQCAGRERQELGPWALGSDPSLSPSMGWPMRPNGGGA